MQENRNQFIVVHVRNATGTDWVPRMIRTEDIIAAEDGLIKGPDESIHVKESFEDIYILLGAAGVVVAWQKPEQLSDWTTIGDYQKILKGKEDEKG